MFFRPSATTGIYTLSLHDALPISNYVEASKSLPRLGKRVATPDGVGRVGDLEDRKSTRLNSSHVSSSYAVFCLKKKNNGARDSRPECDVTSAPEQVRHVQREVRVT